MEPHPELAAKIQENSEAFMVQVGMFVAAWSSIEHALADWFARITGMSNQTARAVFFSANSFSKRADMLSAAALTVKLDSAHNEFLKAVISRARNYSEFRNSTMHGITVAFARPGTRRAGQLGIVEGTLVTGSKHPDSIQAITESDLKRASITLGAFLNHLIEPLQWDGRTLDTSPEKHLELVLRLPNRLDSKESDRKRE